MQTSDEHPQPVTSPSRPHTSLAVKTALGSLLVFVLIVATGVFSYLQSVKQLQASHAIARTHEVLTSVESVSSMLGEAESGLRGYVLCENEQLLDPYRTARSEITAELNKLQALTADNARHQSRIAQLKSRIFAGLKKAEQTVALKSKGDFNEAVNLFK